jgi:hypothetical protein
MELCNSRTMEIYRRLGLSRQIRAAGYPADAPLGVYLLTTMNAPPIAHLPYPTIGEMVAATESRNDGTLPAEPLQRISQYVLEDVLLQALAEQSTVDLRWANELDGLSQDPAGVTAYTVGGTGGRQAIRADYVVGPHQRLPGAAERHEALQPPFRNAGRHRSAVADRPGGRRADGRTHHPDRYLVDKHADRPPLPECPGLPRR